MIHSRILGKLIMGLVLLGSTLTPASDLAFTHVNLGEPAPPMRLGIIGGGMENYLSSEPGQTSVFAFIKSNHQRSQHLVEEWAHLQADFADHPVHWTLIISDRHETDTAAPWDSLAPGATVLVDSGDQLYSQLGVVLTPTVGIVDKDGLVQAYLPFRQINYPTAIGAHLSHILGKTSLEERDALLNPSGHAKDSQQAVAKRKIKLGRMLLSRGRPEAALLQVEDALAQTPELQDGYFLLAEIYRSLGREEDAVGAEARANKLLAVSEDSTSVINKVE